MSNIFFGLTDNEYQKNKHKKKICIEDDDSESSDSFIDTFNDLIGGNKNKIPNGGFPPLKICKDKIPSEKIESNKKELTDKEQKKRGYASNNQLTIHTILNNSDVTPMFNISN